MELKVLRTSGHSINGFLSRRQPCPRLVVRLEAEVAVEVGVLDPLLVPVERGAALAIVPIEVGEAPIVVIIFVFRARMIISALRSRVSSSGLLKQFQQFDNT